MQQGPVALFDAASPLVPGNGGADMVRAFLVEGAVGHSCLTQGDQGRSRRPAAEVANIKIRPLRRFHRAPAVYMSFVGMFSPEPR